MFLKTILALTAVSLKVSADMSQYMPKARDTQVYYLNQIDGNNPQNEQTYDNFRRSNIVNQQDRRADGEEYKDMLPCKTDIPMENPVVYTPGSQVQYQMRFNNPHWGQCEVNLWKKVGEEFQVATLKTPSECGGGFQREQFNFTMPNPLPFSCGPNEGCFMQLYYYSAEPRDYASCTDIVVNDGPAGPRAQSKATTRKALIFNDGYDHGMVDQDYNQYRGQQNLLKPFADRAYLRSAVGRGAISKLTTKALEKERADLEAEVNNLIKAAEKVRKSVLGDADGAVKSAQRKLKKDMIAKFKSGNGASKNIIYPEEKRSAGVDALGVYDVNDDNMGRQNTNTYYQGMDFEPIVQTLKSRIESFIKKRKETPGNWFPPSDGKTAQKIPAAKMVKKPTN